MKRREVVAAPFLLAGLGSSALAQSASRVHRIGVLSLHLPRERFLSIPARLRVLGYEEGRDFVLDYRFAGGNQDKLAQFAAGLVASNVDIIIAYDGNDSIIAAKRATSTIPIVMVGGGAPVESGLIASLAQPGGNVTGTAWQGPEVAGKVLEVVRDLVPRVKRVSILVELDLPSMDLYLRETERAANAMGIQLATLQGRNDGELQASFTRIERQRPDALYVVIAGAITAQRDRIIEFAARLRLPAIYTTKQPVTQGGLISYSLDVGNLVNRTTAIIDRVLKGAKPADIPVEQPTKYELVINLKTAKALGLTIPQSLLLRADEVIQ